MAGRKGARKGLTYVFAVSREKRMTWKDEKPGKPQQARLSEPSDEALSIYFCVQSFCARFLWLNSMPLRVYYDRNSNRIDYHSDRNKERLMEGQRRAR